MNSVRTERWRITELTRFETFAITAQERSGTLRYSYEADGKSYTSERIAFGFPDIPRFYAAHLVRRLARHRETLSVKFDPRKPESSVLLSGFQSFHAARLAPLVIGLVFFLVLMIRTGS